jgi:NitT/TauT family transport system substrate-binding protein
MAPLLVAEPFLLQEGFTSVQYIIPPTAGLSVDDVASGKADLSMQFSGPSILYVDANKPITMLAGIHVGCFVLFGSPQIKVIGDLKGTNIAVTQMGGIDQVYLASMLANVNIDPNKDVTWTTESQTVLRQLFIDGKVDALITFPPTVQELMDKQIGHVVVNSMMDTPWSNYFCCMATFNRSFAQNYPVATKAALRALLMATDVCALQPQQAARTLVTRGLATNYQYALEAMQEIPYNRWRMYDPADTIRFYSLLLHGVGMIKNTPDQILQQGTNWRFINELVKEMPATPVPTGSLAATRDLFCAVQGSLAIGAQPPHNAE